MASVWNDVAAPLARWAGGLATEALALLCGAAARLGRAAWRPTKRALRAACEGFQRFTRAWWCVRSSSVRLTVTSTV